MLNYVRTGITELSMLRDIDSLNGTTSFRLSPVWYITRCLILSIINISLLAHLCCQDVSMERAVTMSHLCHSLYLTHITSFHSTHSLMRSRAHSLTHSLTYSTHSPTHSLTLSLTRPVTHSPSHSPSHSLNTHSLARSLAHSLSHTPIHPASHTTISPPTHTLTDSRTHSHMHTRTLTRPFTH